MSSGNKPVASFAFYTVVEDEAIGYFGGYLALNAQGRPLEFHCTAPVLPSRAHRILYGKQLASALIGERIGVALHARSKSQPQAVLTDLADAFELQQHIDTPVALIADDPPRELIGDKLIFRDWNLLCHNGETTLIEERLNEITESLDLLEPFIRIREAIAEAKKAPRGESARPAA